MKISKEKKEKISEQILAFLFQENPKPIFTAHIARELARDEEFTRSLLEELRKKDLIIKINKNKEGILYIKRRRWKLSPSAYNLYRRIQI